jgi:hypothetical protein
VADAPRVVVITLAATNGSSLLWYLARGSGLAALVAPIGWKDTVIPFVSAYRPFWLGLGALAFDLLIALLVTSLVRQRIGHRTWRVVHWFAYLCWPLVVVHGLGTGSDAQVGLVLILNVLCVGAVILALWWRLATGWPERVGVRVGALLTSIVAPILLVVWLASGPLAAGWAARAGTPASLLVHVSSTPTTAAPTGAAAPSSTLASAPFSAALSGPISQSNVGADGRVTVRLAMTMTGGAAGVLEVDLTGTPVDGGGVLLDTSVVTLGPAAQPTQYQGTVSSLRGTQIVATVRSSGRPTLQLNIAAQPDTTGTRVSGSVHAAVSGAR